MTSNLGVSSLLAVCRETEEDIRRVMGRREIKKFRTNLSYSFAKANQFKSYHWIKLLHRNI